MRIIFVGAVILMIVALFTPAGKHYCKYQNCPQRGNAVFEPEDSEGFPGDKRYTTDSLHFAHPDKSFEELDRMVNEPIQTKII